MLARSNADSPAARAELGFDLGVAPRTAQILRHGATRNRRRAHIVRSNPEIRALTSSAASLSRTKIQALRKSAVSTTATHRSKLQQAWHPPRPPPPCSACASTRTLCRAPGVPIAPAAFSADATRALERIRQAHGHGHRRLVEVGLAKLEAFTASARLRGSQAGRVYRDHGEPARGGLPPGF